MSDWTQVFAIIGFSAISLALVIIGLLSQRLGRVTRANAYYIGFYVAAFLVVIGVGVRIVNFSGRIVPIEQLDEHVLWVLLYTGAPAIGITLGVIIAWRYWSWLLAERG